MGGEIPGIGISWETGSLMLRLTKKDTLRVHIKDKSKVVPNTSSANIIADLPGKSDEWIVIGGHYDGHDISHGAMDNLSGTVTTLELARALQPYKGKFKRGIRFICFACEEIGVTGSTCYVANNLDTMKNTCIMINLELGGLANHEGTKHAAFTVYQPPEMKEWLSEFIKEIQYPTSVNTGTSAASDHWPFYMQGVPSIYMHAEPSFQQLIIGRGWGHTTADMMDKVDPKHWNEKNIRDPEKMAP
jgi:Zn-dependent M28 family amino/carboxypeptidase